MPNEYASPNYFELPPLRLERLQSALTEARYMVTLVGEGKRLMVAPKLADIIVQLKRGNSLDDAARELSLKWEREVEPETLRLIIEQQMLPRGIAYPAGQAPASAAAARLRATKPPGSTAGRLLAGQFRWRMLSPKLVGKICSPLTFCYERISVLLALLMVVATRWLLYTTFDRHFIRQVMTEFTPNEYLLSLALLVALVLVHEFGHASAQMRYGLPAGGIGFQFYHYLPAFFANVDASWRLKPWHRVVVDAGGIYFQAVAGSLLFLAYLKTNSLPVLAAVVTSDILILVAVNPFLRFDGYWLLADALAVPNLHARSSKILAQYWKRLRGAAPDAHVPLLKGARVTAVVAYGLLRRGFWLMLGVLLILRVRDVSRGAWGTLSGLWAYEMEALRTWDVSLAAASLIRLTLFSLLLLALCTLLVRAGWEVAKLARNHLRRALQRGARRGVEGVVQG